MNRNSLRIENALIVTMNPTRDIVTGGLLVRDGVIAAVGELPESPGVPVIEAGGLVALPGFVQTHVHLCQTLFRNLADDMSLLEWLRKRIWPLEAAHDEDSIRSSARLGVAELLLGGTTTILDMGTVRHTDVVFEVLRETGIRATAGKAMMDGPSDLPGALRDSRDGSLEETETLFREWHGAGDGRLRYAPAPRFALAASGGLLRDAGEFCREHGLLFHSHAAENRDECSLVREKTGMGNVEYLDFLDVLGGNTCLAHCIWLDDGDMDILSGRDVKVVHCPGSNLKLGSGTARIPEMLERGISVSLGSDGAACNNNLSIFQEMRLAALIQKPGHGPSAMPAREVVRMATIGGAEALGLGQEIGSLEPGKRGDVVLLDPCGVHSVPMEDPYPQIVYSMNAGDVHTAIVDGRVLVDNRRLTFLDEEKLVRDCSGEVENLLRRAEKGLTE